jgi:hypothetical protein
MRPLFDFHLIVYSAAVGFFAAASTHQTPAHIPDRLREPYVSTTYEA